MIKQIGGLLLGLSLAVTNVIPLAHAAEAKSTIKVVGPSATQKVNTNFSIDLKIDTGGQPVGGVRVTVSYSDKLEYVGIDTTGSAFDTEVIAPSPSNNKFSFERIKISGGENSSNAHILKVTFKPKSTGDATISIDKADSEAVNYDDQTNVLANVSGLNINIDNASTTTTTSTPRPSTSSTTTATAAASASTSTVTVSSACVEASPTSATELKIFIKDSKGSILSSDTYTPTVTLGDATLGTVKIADNGDGWTATVMGVTGKTGKTTATIKTKTNVTLNAKPEITFGSCATATTVPTQAPTPVATISAIPLETEEPASATIVRAAILGFLFLCLIGLIWALWKLRQPE